MGPTVPHAEVEPTRPDLGPHVTLCALIGQRRRHRTRTSTTSATVNRRGRDEQGAFIPLRLQHSPRPLARAHPPTPANLAQEPQSCLVSTPSITQGPIDYSNNRMPRVGEASAIRAPVRLSMNCHCRAFPSQQARICDGRHQLELFPTSQFRPKARVDVILASFGINAGRQIRHIHQHRSSRSGSVAKIERSITRGRASALYATNPNI